MTGKLGDVTMNNGATIVNTDANTLTITEATTAISGALTTGGNLSVTGASTLSGNVTLGNESTDTITMTGKLGDVTMNNGATIVNTDANTLTITEATTAISGELTALVSMLV